MRDAHRLTLEEKIGQLFVVGFQGYELDSETRAVLEIVRPGGFVLFQRNIEGFDQIYELTTALRHASAIPAFIAIDQEGGRVDRLKQIFAPIPPMSELAGVSMAHLRLGARIVAAELEATGFNLAFAPVLDLGLPGSILAERCLASHPEEVSRLGTAFVEELSKRGIMACTKHFPGLGGAAVDPHFALPRVDRNRKQLLNEDVMPFASLFAQAGMVLVSHAHYPNLGDEKPVPASMSPRVIDSVLRKKLGFKGVVITDDLTMGAVTSIGLTPDLFLRAFEAGNDLLFFSQTTPLLEQAFRTILRTARGSVPLRRRIDESVERLLALKGRFESTSLRYRTHLRARITRQIEKLRKSIEPLVPTPASSGRRSVRP